VLEPGDKEIFESVQDERGVDIEQIRELLSLSLEERYERYRRGMANYLWLKRAGEHSRSTKDSEGTR
jgi:hypothetical protein